VFLLFSQTKLARVLGWLKGLGQWLRRLAKQNDLYADRRAFQIVATVAVAVVVVVLLLYGLLWMWHYIKRYRLAIGFASLAVGLGAIRFISLHEVDAWNRAMPWARVVVELTAAAGASAWLSPGSVNWESSLGCGAQADTDHRLVAAADSLDSSAAIARMA